MKFLARMRLLALAMVLNGAVGAQTLEQAVGAYEDKDYKTAFAGLTNWAEQGNASAQFNLALMYTNGIGVPKNDSLVVYWYCRAAEQGNANAQFNLGSIYADGSLVTVDAEQAYFWWLLSSTQGHQASIKNRDIVEGRLSQMQRANTQRSVQEWTPKSSGRESSCARPTRFPQ